MCTGPLQWGKAKYKQRTGVEVSAIVTEREKKTKRRKYMGKR